MPLKSTENGKNTQRFCWKQERNKIVFYGQDAYFKPGGKSTEHGKRTKTKKLSRKLLKLKFKAFRRSI